MVDATSNHHSKMIDVLVSRKSNEKVPTRPPFHLDFVLISLEFSMLPKYRETKVFLSILFASWVVVVGKTMLSEFESYAIQIGQANRRVEVHLTIPLRQTN